jgi:hypothetical protein
MWYFRSRCRTGRTVWNSGWVVGGRMQRDEVSKDGEMVTTKVLIDVVIREWTEDLAGGGRTQRRPPNDRVLAAGFRLPCPDSERR